MIKLLIPAGLAATGLLLHRVLHRNAREIARAHPRGASGTVEPPLALDDRAEHLHEHAIPRAGAARPVAQG
ncbi:hypothetical protein ACQ5SO_09030 [Rhodovulum sp. DZ06]|uniref:hypothetical protein n=1 Tax=Rhodovulum sp. DZ06 TaxID=3425126 RepID=UPI003D32E92A